MGQGIHLTLDWPREVPLVDDLRVVVAYTRLDGVEVRGEKVLHPRIQATTVAGWVPAARSQDESVATASTVHPPRELDPFALAQQIDSQPTRTVFRTVPIPTTAADPDENSTASWTEPIPQSRGQLTPIHVVKLQSIEQRIFGDDRPDDDRPDDDRPDDDELKVKPVHPSMVSLLPAGTAEEVETTAGPAWTPYR
jgi:hypothetical protein